jgi:hypothetical protein
LCTARRREVSISFMTISHEKWHRWLAVLEDILHEADVHREYSFGIHIDAAILAVHAKLGTERVAPNHDPLPNDEG